MEAISIVALVLSAAAVVLLAVLIAITLKNKKTDTNVEINQEVLSQLKSEILREGASTRESIVNNINLQNNNMQLLLGQNRDAVDSAAKRDEERSDKLNTTVYEGLLSIRNNMAATVKDMNESNEKQLEKMRQTVDEKLSATLDQRFKASFNIVAETLENITKNVGEMKSLTNDVVDLRRVLTNVKTRGTWGEVSLDNLLSQLLTPDQYEKSFKLDKKGGDDKMVDFAIKMPGKDDVVYLPVDAKFPVADYERIVNAETFEEQAVARKAFEKDIKTQAASISAKYINPPMTTNFAVMYLPTEGLFAEATQIAGLQDELQQKYRVTLCSPTTLGAFLNCLQMGFKTVAIEKRSSEIWNLMARFKKDFELFSGILAKTQRQLQMVNNSIIEANKRTGIIKKNLKKVEVDDEDLLEAVTADVAVADLDDNSEETTGDADET